MFYKVWSINVRLNLHFKHVNDTRALFSFAPTIDTKVTSVCHRLMFPCGICSVGTFRNKKNNNKRELNIYSAVNNSPYYIKSSGII